MLELASGAAVTTVAALLLSFDPPPTGYAVQVGVVKETTNETLLKDELKKQGWSNVGVIDSQDKSGARRVVVGRFPSYADAEWERLALRRRGFGDAFITTATTAMPWSDWRIDGPDTTVFGRNPAPPTQTRDARTGKLEARAAVVPGTLSERTGFPEFLRTRGNQGNPKRNPADGMELVRLTPLVEADKDLRELVTEAYRANAPTKEQNAVLLDRLMPLARNAGGKLSPRDTALARLAVARVEQSYRMRKLTAYRAYAEVLDYCAAHPELEDVARIARLAMAASLLEVSLGKYPLSDVRRAAAHLYGTGDRNIDARIAVYSAAMLSHDRRADQSTQAFRIIADHYADYNNVVANALLFEGVNHQFLGRPDQALTAFQAASEIPIADGAIAVYRGKPMSAQRLALNGIQHITVADRKSTEALSQSIREIDGIMARQLNELILDCRSKVPTL
jgi:hypothetical protein